MSNKKKQNCIVKNNSDIRELLFKRITEQKMLWIDVVADAKKYDRLLHISQISRYFNGTTQNALCQDDILWLCMRYGINVSIEVTANKYNEKKHIQAIKRNYH